MAKYVLSALAGGALGYGICRWWYMDAIEKEKQGEESLRVVQEMEAALGENSNDMAKHFSHISF